MILLKAFNKTVELFRKLTGAFGLIGAVGLFLMVALTFVDVILRYFFKSPITGSQEMVQFLMVITMYGGMPYAAAKGMLLTVDALAKKFHPAVRRSLRLFFTVLCAVSSGMMCVKIFQQFQYYLNNPMQKSSILKWPFTPFYFFAALGLFLLSVELILEIVLCAADFRRGAGPASEKEEIVNE